MRNMATSINIKQLNNTITAIVKKSDKNSFVLTKLKIKIAKNKRIYNDKK